MKAQELRIGNIVYGLSYDEDDNEQREICEVICIDGTGGNIADYYLWVDSKSNKERFNSFEPIPLTEEWLLRLGYTDENKFNFLGSFGLVKNNTGIYCLSYLSDYCQTRFESIMVQFVHQLQNLYFCLCGKELQIIS